MSKIKDFIFYKNIIIKNKDFLEKTHNIKIDWIYRMYKLYTFDKEDIYNIKVYGEKYVETIIKKEIKKIDNTILNLKLFELVGVYNIEPFPEIKSVGITFGFKRFNTVSVANKLIWFILLFLGIGIGTLISFKSVIIITSTWLFLFIINKIFSITKIKTI